MKQTFTAIILGVLISTTSCNNVDRGKLQKETKNQTNEINTTNAADILKDFKTWYNYTYYNIHLSQDFIGLDTNSSTINKTQFLERLATGKFVCLKINSENSLPFYQLYKLHNNDPDIKSTISEMALTETLHFKMEEKEFPDYNFIDLNGKTYDKATTKGKILVIKCWFIRCVACVKEFPELNKLVDKYKNRDDIQFISLASDSKPDLPHIAAIQKKIEVFLGFDCF